MTDVVLAELDDPDHQSALRRAYALGLGINSMSAATVAFSAAAGKVLHANPGAAEHPAGSGPASAPPLPLADSPLALVDAGVIAYCRPFTRNRGVEQLRPLADAAEQRQLHDRLMSMRSKAVAHMDSEGIDIEIRCGKGTDLYYAFPVPVAESAGASYYHLLADPRSLLDCNQLALATFSKWQQELQDVLTGLLPSGLDTHQRVVIRSPQQVHQATINEPDQLMRVILGLLEQEPPFPHLDEY